MTKVFVEQPLASPGSANYHNIELCFLVRPRNPSAPVSGAMVGLQASGKAAMAHQPTPSRIRCLVSSGRNGFLLVLTILQLIFFGLPALKVFQDSGVSVEERMETGTSLPAPAVTLCPFEVNFSGWRNRSGSRQPHYLTSWDVHCHEAESTQDFVTCVEQKTFTLGETLSNGSSHTPPLKVGACPRSDTMETEKAIFHLLPMQSSLI